MPEISPIEIDLGNSFDWKPLPGDLFLYEDSLTLVLSANDTDVESQCLMFVLEVVTGEGCYPTLAEWESDRDGKVTAYPGERCLRP